VGHKRLMNELCSYMLGTAQGRGPNFGRIRPRTPHILAQAPHACPAEELGTSWGFLEGPCRSMSWVASTKLHQSDVVEAVEP
jgi:hypothetical protein